MRPFIRQCAQFYVVGVTLNRQRHTEVHGSDFMSSVEKDVKIYIKAAEVHFNAELGDPVCNKKEKVMLELCKKYFMTEDEKEFYDSLFNCDSNIAKELAIFESMQFRYNLADALALLERCKIERWVFSNDAKRQEELMRAIDNRINILKETIVKQQNFNDDRLFRQIVMYGYYVGAYTEAWINFKFSKADEYWQKLIDYTRQIIVEGKGAKLFSEMCENGDRTDKLVASMLSAELNFDMPLAIKTLKNLIVNNQWNPRRLAFTKEQLAKIESKYNK
jgi:hypothetical protein